MPERELKSRQDDHKDISPRESDEIDDKPDLSFLKVFGRTLSSSFCFLIFNFFACRPA